MSGLSLFKTHPYRSLTDLWFERDEFSPHALCDIQESASNYLIKMDVPGFEKEQIELDYKNQILTVTGQWSEEKEESSEDKRWHVRERSRRNFQRSFRLNDNIEFDHIKANLKDGVLSVELPKKGEAQAKKITISE